MSNLNRLSYDHGRAIERMKYERDWPYYGLVLAAQRLVVNMIGEDAAKQSVFAEMLRRFAGLTEHHERAADDYMELAVKNSWVIGGLIQALMRRADSQNKALLVDQFPDIYADLLARYDAPGGVLPHDGEEEEAHA